MEQTKARSLKDMANGAIKERLDYEMGRVIQNISDPNTKATAKRTITVKITLEPDEERQHVEVSATASSTRRKAQGILHSSSTPPAPPPPNHLQPTPKSPIQPLRPNNGSRVQKAER